MRVESVSWIAERKDVLYAFFYFTGLITWLRYTEGSDKKWYWTTLVLFVASCLSKPMAVVFPLSLILIDFLTARNWDKKVLTDKIPFFLVALICGGGAYYTQNATGAIADFGKLTVAERVMYASYGFDMYISKFFNPTYLSTFYPYPYRFIDGSLSTIYYLAPVIAILLPAGFIYIVYRSGRHQKANNQKTDAVAGELPFAPRRFDLPTRIAIFGFGYLFANLVFVLQFISCGAAIMADRYSYVAYVGWIFMLVYFVHLLLDRMVALRVALYGLLVMATGWFAWLCQERTYVWHDSETLLTDAIEKYPRQALLSYKWLGNYYLDQGQLDKALESYGVLTSLHAADAKVWDNVGNIYLRKHDARSALQAFDQSIGVQNNVYKTYLDRAIALNQLGDTANARADLEMAARLNPEVAGAMLPAGARAGSRSASPSNSGVDSCLAALSRGDTAHALRSYLLAMKSNPETERTLAQLGFNYVNSSRQFEPAIRLYNMLLKFNSAEPHYFFYRGVALYSTGNVPAAKADWLIAVKMNSTEVKQSASNNLSVVFDNEGDYDKALYYAEMAKGLGYNVEPAFIEKLRNRKAGKK
jgi:protein O-mannosyl-transferase